MSLSAVTEGGKERRGGGGGRVRSKDGEIGGMDGGRQEVIEEPRPEGRPTAICTPGKI